MPYDAIKKATKGKVRTTGVSAFSEIEINKVFPNAKQPRKSFDDIDGLASSIKVNGLVQPIAVVKRDKGYMIVSGERRYKACKYLGLKTIKCHILQANDKQVAEIALVENIQRDDLTDFEKAQFIQHLWASGNYAKKQDLANAIGKSPSYISKAFKAVNLCDEVIADIEQNKREIGLDVLRELSSIKDKQHQSFLYFTHATREDIREQRKKEKERKTQNDKKEISPAKKVWEYQLDVISYSPFGVHLRSHTEDDNTHNIDVTGSSKILDKNTKYKITIEAL